LLEWENRFPDAGCGLELLDALPAAFDIRPPSMTAESSRRATAVIAADRKID